MPHGKGAMCPIAQGLCAPHKWVSVPHGTGSTGSLHPTVSSSCAPWLGAWTPHSKCLGTLWPWGATRRWWGRGGAVGHHGDAAHTDIKQSFISEVAKPQRVTVAAAPALPHTPWPCPMALPHSQPCHTPPALSRSPPHSPLPHRLSHNPPAPRPALPHRLPHSTHTHLPPSSGAGRAPQCAPVPPRVP